MSSKEMMQLQPVSDALKGILLNAPRGPNLAVTRDVLSSRQLPPSLLLLRESLLPRNDRCTLVLWDGLRLVALASARMRTGPRAWEIQRLYLPTLTPSHALNPTSGHPSPNGRRAEDEGSPTGRGTKGKGYGEKELVELLEGLTLYAGNQGAERVFLRVPYAAPVAHIAQRTGFFPYFKETLLQGSGSRGQGQANASMVSEKVGLRPRLLHEEYALFQLYSASTPGSVRSGLGMTFEQWKDSSSRAVGKIKEEVYESEGKIRAWLGSDPSGRILRSKPAQMELMVHPDREEMMPALLDHALARKGAQLWLVPEYQESLRRSLIHRGFREVAHYSVLIKTMAVRVKSPSLAHVEARVW